MTHGWYPLGKYLVFAMPLPLNPAWTTHHIYIGSELIGRQLSVPSESDCDWHLSNHRHPIDSKKVIDKPYGYSTNHRPRGRPRKADAARELEEALSA